MLDVTDRHAAEDELRRLEKQLRQAQRLEAMGTLAGGIAHDFNNILGAILGYGEMALRGAPKGSRLRRDLDSIMTAGERGRALVDRVLAFSRSGWASASPCTLKKWCARRSISSRRSCRQACASRRSCDAGRAAMLGDPTQVHQVLMNLGTNAVQAMPSGGTLSVSLDTVRCEVGRAATIASVEAGEYVVLTVADTGTGIARDIIERIFDPFFTTKEVGTGTGLGLSLVHGIVTELGGAIDVASVPGQGSAFTVYLPRSGEAVEADEAEAAAMPRGDGQQVLIVDDEEPLVRLATETLAELGYAPVGFTSSSRRAGGLSRRAGAVRRGDHRRAHAEDDRIGADPRAARHPARDPDPADERLCRRRGGEPRARGRCERGDEEAAVGARARERPCPSAPPLRPGRFSGMRFPGQTGVRRASRRAASH